MATLDAIPAWRISEFRAEVRHRLQVMGGRLRNTVNFRGGYSGIQSAVVNYLGETKAKRIVDRKGLTPLMEVNHERRWVDPVGFEWGHLDDRFDRLFTGISATGEYTEAGVKAMRREEDLEIMNGFFRTSKTGETGTTLETYASINTSSRFTVAESVGGANTGLNRAKLNALRAVFTLHHVDLENTQIHMIITEEEVEDLMSDTTLLSSDYMSRKALVDGQLPPILGFNFHVFSSAYLNANVPDFAVATNVRTLPVWVQDGMHLAMWEEMNIDAGKDPAHKFNWLVYMSSHYGATRLEPAKVLQVKTYHA
jgi:hypothetical protein